MDKHDHGRDRYVRKVTLPSGKTIEVATLEPLELHICPECTSDLVYPTDWDEAANCRWEVTLRCPNCEWTDTDTFEEAQIQRFDETLDRGTETLVSDLRLLVRENMEDDVERFIAALYAEHIMPMDF